MTTVAAITTAQVAIVSSTVLVAVIAICLTRIRLSEQEGASAERKADSQADVQRERRGADAAEAAVIRAEATERDRRAAESE